MSDLIKIKMSYEDKSLTLNLPKNKPFKILTEKAQTFLFHPKNKEYDFYDKLKLINENESKTLGEVFGVRNNVVLKLSDKNYKNNNNNRPKKLNNSRSKSPDSNTENYCKECSSKKNINNCNIAYFCRECNCFLCKNCRLEKVNGEHYSHNVLQLFNSTDAKNSKKNTELYKQLLLKDINALKNKLNQMNIQQKNKTDSVVWKKILTEKVDLIYKLLNKKLEGIIEFPEDVKITSSDILDEYKINIESIRDDNNILEITNDPLCEFNKINEFDQKLFAFKRIKEGQINNETILKKVIDLQAQMNDLFKDIESCEIEENSYENNNNDKYENMRVENDEENEDNIVEKIEDGY